jgi:hypothetical protein
MGDFQIINQRLTIKILLIGEKASAVWLEARYLSPFNTLVFLEI